MRYFFDTSALAKRYSPEKGTPHVDAIVMDPDSEIWISELAVLEILSTLSRKVREGFLKNNDLDLTLMALMVDMATRNFKTLPLSSDVVTGTCMFLLDQGTKVPLRTLDALHVQSALTISKTQALDFFVVSDKRLKAAVQALSSFEILDPEQIV